MKELEDVTGTRPISGRALASQGRDRYERRMSTLYCPSGARWLSYSNPYRSWLCRLFRAAALEIPVRIWTRVTAATLLGLAGAGLVAAAGAPIPEDVLFERDLEFSKPEGQSLQLNIARPRKAIGTLPAILCIHGGGFRAGTREGYDGLCIKLAQNGYVAATVTYRLSPASKFPAAVHDCKSAVRWLKANSTQYGIDPTRIGATGGSAGGHLALFLGVTSGIPEFEGEGNLNQSSSVACVVSFSGPSDFTKSYGKSVDAHEVLPLFFGGNLVQMPKEHVRGSPLYWVTPNAAPTLCIHGTQDDYVGYEQAVWITERLKAAAVEARLLTLEGAGHGFKGDDAAKADREMLSFFDGHLKRPVPAAN